MPAGPGKALRIDMGLCDVVHLQFSASDAYELFSQIAVSGQLQVNLNALESKANTVNFEGLRRQVLLKPLKILLLSLDVRYH